MSIVENTEFLSSTYRRYKKDTAYIAGWLVESAKRIGFKLSDTQQPTTAPAPTQRLKGKERKAAKTKNEQLNALKGQPEHLICTADFIPVAEQIAAQASKVPVPSGLLTLFGRAIKARKQAQAWYKSAQLDDVGHEHFINILTKVQDILRPLVPVVQTTRSDKTRSPDDESTANRFSKLTVEEIAQEETEDRDANIAKLPPVVPAQIEQNDRDTEDEFFFAIHLFLKGIHELQDVVQETWFKRQDLNMDQMASGLLANMAIDLVRRAEDQLESLLVRPRQFPISLFPVWTLPALLYYHYHPLPDTVNVRDAAYPSGVDVTMEDMEYDEIHANWCFWPVYTSLKLCVNHASKFKVLDIEESHLASAGGNKNSDIKRIYKLAKMFQTYTMTTKKIPAQDEVTRGMKLLFQQVTSKDKSIPIWVVFGMQTLLDIQDIMDYSMGEGKGYNVPWNNLRGVFVEQSLLEYSSWWPPFALCRNKTSIALPKKCLKDMDEIEKVELERDDPSAIKYNPIRCGLMKYNLHRTMHRCGLELERESGLCLVMAHLYTAGKLLHPNACAWPDMEYLLDMQDPERIFYGGVPKTLDEAYRKCILTFGGKMPQSANLSKFPWPKKSRRFEDTSLLSPILEKRMTSQKELTNDSANTLANSLNATLCDGASRVQLARQLQASPEFIDEILAVRRVTTLFEETAMEGPPILLRDLTTFADGEILDVSFDWVLMYRTCGEMWKSIMEELREDPDCEDVLRNLRDPHPMLGHRILEFAAKDEASHGEILVDDINFALPLRKAFQVISNIVHAEGSTEDYQDERYAHHKVWKGDHCLVREFERGTLTSTWEITNTQPNVLYNKYYKGWIPEELDDSFALLASIRKIHYNYRCRERDLDLLLFGIQDPCDIDEPDHTNDDCGRCRRRDFYLRRYGSASDFRGSGLVERKLKEKYHGKNDGLVKYTDEEQSRIMSLMRRTGHMDTAAAREAMLQELFSEHDLGQVSTRKRFIKPDTWKSISG